MGKFKKSLSKRKAGRSPSSYSGGEMHRSGDEINKLVGKDTYPKKFKGLYKVSNNLSKGSMADYNPATRTISASPKGNDSGTLVHELEHRRDFSGPLGENLSSQYRAAKDSSGNTFGFFVKKDGAYQGGSPRINAKDHHKSPYFEKRFVRHLKGGGTIDNYFDLPRLGMDPSRQKELDEGGKSGNTRVLRDYDNDLETRTRVGRNKTYAPQRFQPTGLYDKALTGGRQYEINPPSALKKSLRSKRPPKLYTEDEKVKKQGGKPKVVKPDRLKSFLDTFSDWNKVPDVW